MRLNNFGLSLPGQRVAESCRQPLIEAPLIYLDEELEMLSRYAVEAAQML